MSVEDYREADFEYESEAEQEAGDESEAEPEAGDESWGMEGDEGDEGDEGAYSVEADEGDEGDEGDESETIGASMEGDEADEADEGDEGLMEAVRLSASARLRMSRDRSRRAAWARKVASAQRLEAQRAQASQRALTSRIKAIPITRRTKVASVGSLQGAGVVTAILPNGRRTRMRIIPTVAPISEVNRLRTVVLTNEKRQAAAIATNAKAVTSLASAQTAAVKRLTDQQVKSDKDLSRRVVEGDNRLDARITKELSGGSGILDKHGKRMMRVLKRERRRAMMNNVLLATSVPFFLAYGDRDSPFTTDNAILTGSTLFWLLGDDAISSFTSEKGWGQSLASVWSYGAPIANGGGLYFWFRNKQNQRFLAGVTPVKTDGSDFEVDVFALMKSGGNKDLSGHSVVASFVDRNSSGSIRAVLDTNGKMFLSIVPGTLTSPPALLPATMPVAWIVDTKPVAKTIEK
jgi:hypothetical protein